MQRRAVLLVKSDRCSWIALRAILEEMQEFRIVGEATDAPQARHLAAELRPDVIICDTELDDGRPVLSLLTDLRQTLRPSAKFVLMAPYIAPDALVDLATAGLTNHLLWNDVSADALRHSLAAAISGDIAVASQQVVQAFVDAKCPLPPEKGTPPILTDRERMVLQLLNKAMTREEIAEEMETSTRTVTRIIGELKMKLNAPDKFVLGAKAAQFGLLD